MFDLAPETRPDRITVTGARQNNLKNITVHIPKHAITVFTGVSGSGKTSLVFDTIAAEAQRQLNETFTAFARTRLPDYGQPDLDSIDNLSAAVIVDQKRLTGGPRSTVGTATDINATLRLLYSHAGHPHTGPANTLSFNDPHGMCPDCQGTGHTPAPTATPSTRTARTRPHNTTCTTCHGTRLNEAARNCRIDGYSITDLTAMEATELIAVLRLFTDHTAAPIVAALLTRVRHLTDIGLGYLTLDRDTNTLSGGESQRVKTVRHLSSPLVEMLYIFDEPSIGLHPHDITRLNTHLRHLRDKGNTVLVVEHDRDVINIADHIIDLGPGAGTHGGDIVYEGSLEALPYARTPTGQHMRHRPPLNTTVRTPTGHLTITDATTNNLKKVTVDIPTGILTAVTGVAGSGKSSLINHAFLTQHPTAITIDQTPLATSNRSNAATHTRIMDPIRALFAKTNNADPGLFSANSKGACPTCHGLGTIHTDLAFMASLKTTCQDCGGRRYRPEVLHHQLRGHTIADILDMTTEEAATILTEPNIQPALHALTDAGLGYLTLGQPLSTLSGGECQRVKLATHLHRTGTVYVMDEPTTGLHLADITHLLGIIDRLVTHGNTVIVIEHHLDVIKHADWIIDLGPEAGTAGGTITFEGTPEQLTRASGSHTATALRRDLDIHERPTTFSST
ncbi:excinuclease ABC subunit UvrA [Dactylosporangium sp. NPDC005555]|uniref:excinuclease ABC subunit UvrA n=1 Tax=Dactylosporangium sp. NPDC005555 TaxID=3154889 RepID=UPI0033A6E0AE